MQESISLILGSWIIITLATERATEIINVGKIFGPLRLFLGRMAYPDADTFILTNIFLFIHNMMTCAWCLSVWVSMALCWFLPGEYFAIAAYGNIVVKWLGLIGMANLWHAIFRLIFNGRVITIDVTHRIGRAEELPTEGDENDA